MPSFHNTSTLSTGLAGRQRETNRQTGLMEQTDRVQAVRELLLVPSFHNTTLSTGLAGRQRETNRQTGLMEQTDRQGPGCMAGNCYWCLPFIILPSLQGLLDVRGKLTNRQGPYWPGTVIGAFLS